MKVISRDPVAREELLAEAVPAGDDTCAWCGSAPVRRGRRRLYRYWVQRDDGHRPTSDRRLFCGVDCYRMFHGR